MSIARDANSTATLGASPRTGSHTVSGSNTTLWLGSKGAAGYSTGATYNGVSMTRVADITSGVGEYYLSMFQLIAPSTGTNTVSVTVASSSVGWTAESYTGCDQTTQPDNSFTTNTASATATITTSYTTVTDNAWVVGYYSSSANTLTASTGVNFLIAQLNNVALGDSNGAVTPAGSYSMTTTASSGTHAHILAAIRPFVANTYIPFIMFS